jgi:hypothetical protein
MSVARRLPWAADVIAQFLARQSHGTADLALLAEVSAARVYFDDFCSSPSQKSPTQFGPHGLGEIASSAYPPQSPTAPAAWLALSARQLARLGRKGLARLFH